MSKTKTFRITDRLRAWRFQRQQERRARGIRNQRLQLQARRDAIAEEARDLDCLEIALDVFERGQVACCTTTPSEAR